MIPNEIKYVYCLCYPAPPTNSPKAFTGVYFAKRGTTGIWYWQRKVKQAFVFKGVHGLVSEDAGMVTTALGNISDTELVGFIRWEEHELPIG